MSAPRISIELDDLLREFNEDEQRQLMTTVTKEASLFGGPPVRKAEFATAKLATLEQRQKEIREQGERQTETRKIKKKRAKMIKDIEEGRLPIRRPAVEVGEEEEEEEMTEQETERQIITTQEKDQEGENLNINADPVASNAFKAPIGGPIVPTGSVTSANKEQEASGNTMTDLMLIQQNQLSEIKKKLEQNNYLKLMELKANQNKVLNMNDRITQDMDRTRFQRRLLESQKLKVEQFERDDAVGRIGNERQFLQQQQYANYHWGIPNVQGIVYGGDEFFTV